MSTDETKLRSNTIGLLGAVTLGAVVMAPALSIYFAFSPIAKSAGKAVPLVYLIAMVASIPTALSYALVSRELPSAGSAYTWLWQALSKPVGVWLGLVMALYYLIMVIIQPPLFGLFFNDALAFVGVPLTESSRYWFWLLGIVLSTAVVAAVTYRGVRVSTEFTVVFLIFESVVVAALAVCAMLFFKGTRHHLDFAAFALPHTAAARLGIFQGLILGVLTFIGYDVVCTIAEEAKTPSKMIPLATVLAMLIPGVYVILVSWALISAVPMADILPVLETQQTPITPIVMGTWGRAGMALVLLTGMTSTVGVYVASMVGCSRVMYAMGRDRTLPAWLGRLHPRFQVPWNAQHFTLAVTLIICAIWGRWVGLFNTFQWWASAIVLLGLVTYLMVNAANFIFYYRFRRERFHWFSNAFIPVVGVVLNGYLLYESFFVALWGDSWKKDWQMGRSIIVTGVGFMLLALGYTLWVGRSSRGSIADDMKQQP